MTINPYEALRHAVFSVLRNIGPAFRISWPWLAVLALVGSVLLYFIEKSGFGQTPLEPEKGAGTALLALLIAIAVFVAAFSSIAVNWHRYILLDDVAKGQNRLRFDGHVLRYIGRMFLASFLTLLIIIVPYLLAISTFANFYSLEEIGQAALFSKEWIALILFQGVFATLAGAILFRSSLCLPAAAIGKFEIGIGESWRRTQGNMWPLAVIAAASFAMQVAAQVLVENLAGVMAAYDTVTGFSVLIAVSVAFTWFFIFFGITILTSLYGFFIEKRQL